MIKKSTPEQLLETNNQITKIKDNLKELLELQSPDAKVFWNRLKSIMKYDIEKNGEKIHKLIAGDFDVKLDQLRLMEGAREAGTQYIRLVENVEEFISKSNTKIAELKETSSKIKDNLELQSEE